MEDDDLVLINEEKIISDEEKISPPVDEIKFLLKENNELIKSFCKSKNKEIFFLPSDILWPFPSIKIPVSSEESYNNVSSIQIIDLVKRSLALMTPYEQEKCVKRNHKKERLILVNYVNRLYNMIQ